MARGRSGRSADTSDIANLTTELLRPVELPDLSPSVSQLDEFLGPTLPYDRRAFSFGEPERYSLVSRGTVRYGQVYRDQIGFGDPSTVAICYRRKQRREVLFAKRRIRGRGGARRRSWRSMVKC